MIWDLRFNHWSNGHNINSGQYYMEIMIWWTSLEGRRAFLPSDKTWRDARRRRRRGKRSQRGGGGTPRDCGRRRPGARRGGCFQGKACCETTPEDCQQVKIDLQSSKYKNCLLTIGCTTGWRRSSGLWILPSSCTGGWKQQKEHNKSSTIFLYYRILNPAFFASNLKPGSLFQFCGGCSWPRGAQWSSWPSRLNFTVVDFLKK